VSSALVLGEALVDIVGGVAHPGGSPLNVAVGLARLGWTTTLHTRIGVDRHGAAIERHLANSGVRLTATSRDALPTSTAEASIGPDGAATYRFAIETALAEPVVAFEQFAVVHSGSIAAVLEPGSRTIERILTAARPHATVSYDPNVRSRLLDDNARERFARLIARADVVKASDEDLAWLHPGVPLDEVLASWLRAGPAVVAITRGGTGSMIGSRAGIVEVPAPLAAVVDTIGAGDSYMAGLLTALDDAGLLGAANRDALAAMSTVDLERTARFAADCAAITVSRPGADPPTRSDLPPAP
jgi:fructokinase